MDDEFLPKSNGYRDLIAFKIALMIRHFTLRFCNNFLSEDGKTHAQMVQAARSGASNIAEESTDSATSKHSEIYLTGIAKGSLQELKEDYLFYLEQHRYKQWPNG